MNGNASTGTCDSQDEYILLLHGGFASAPEMVEQQHLDILNQAVTAGLEALSDGATALDVVEDSIVRLENAGIYDAGKGSYFNSEGYVQNDASLMEGHTGRAGAVAAMQSLRNPIRAARIAMDRTPHVFFAGVTGEATLIELGAEAVDDPKTYFREYRPPAPQAPAEDHGTVGAVALDRCGNLAAGTSTGGTPGKLPGRVGDSPIIGASSFANAKYALSATGIGEHFIRRAATHDIAARAEYLGVPLKAAADYVVRDLIGDIDQAQGAVIAISATGDIALSSNGYGVMYGFGSNALAVSVGAAVKYE